LASAQTHTLTQEHSQILEFSLDNFSKQDYKRATRCLIRTFEEQNNVHFKPGPYKRVGIKVYSRSGPGLSTPHNLVEAVIDFLIEQGYEKKDIFIVDEYARYLRDAGFLPPLSDGGKTFDGTPVLALDSGKYWDVNWFYENALPSREINLFSQVFSPYSNNISSTGVDRKSFLPTVLFLNVDFWINLPMVTSTEALGIGGAVQNISLWNVSNNSRFFTNPAQASIAAAEIAAIPELKNTLAFTILTLERYQYIGSTTFNANYTETEPLLFLSNNPAALDFLMLKRINRERAKQRLPLVESPPPFLEYMNALGFPNYHGSSVSIKNISSSCR